MGLCLFPISCILFKLLVNPPALKKATARQNKKITLRLAGLALDLFGEVSAIIGGFFIPRR